MNRASIYKSLILEVGLGPYTCTQERNGCLQVLQLCVITYKDIRSLVLGEELSCTRDNSSSGHGNTCKSSCAVQTSMHAYNVVEN